MTSFELPGIPGALTWMNDPLTWEVEGQTLRVTAGERTDWFHDPSSESVTRNAPSALFAPPDDSFLLSAKVHVDFASDFDAGVLHIYAHDDLWAKLCFEYSPRQEPMIVSVVTRGRSDDCNSVVIDGHDVYLRMAVTPTTVAFHYSLDGKFWHFVRYFTLGPLESPQVGLLTQAPRGPRASVTFSEVRYRPGTLSNTRNGE